MAGWNLIYPQKAGSAGSDSQDAPFDGKLYLLGSLDRIQSGRWISHHFASGGYWETTHSFANSFWRPIPVPEDPEWMTLSQAKAVSLGGVPSGFTLMVLYLGMDQSERWLTAQFASRGRRWITPEKVQLPEDSIEGAALVRNPPKVSLEAKVSGTLDHLWM